MGTSGIVAFTLLGVGLSPKACLLAERELPAPLSTRARAVVAVALGMVAGLAAWRVDPIVAALATASALGASVLIAAVDASEYRIPNRMVFVGLTCSATLFALQGAFGDGRAAGALLGGALFYGIMAAIYALAPAKMGYGDVKLAAVLGLPLGWQGLLAVPLSLVISAVVGLLVHGVLVSSGRRKWRDVLPFGVYLAIGATATVALGSPNI